MGIEERVRKFIEREQLLDKEQLYLVAVSGGADSVCLLLMLKQLGYRVEAAHCNFNLRGEESLRDENFVKELCQKRDIPLHLTHFDTKTYAELHKVSIEMAARELRYRYFEQLRQDIGAAAVCVAHHQDDSVETILMNLLRGTGLHGLQGIQPRRDLSPLTILRPLLCVSRHDIEQWLKEQGQTFVTDSTNLVPDVVRNLIRLNVIPQLQKVLPQACTNMLATARRLSEAARVYDHAIGESMARLVHDDALSIDELLREPSPESVLYEWLTPKGFSPATIEAIYQTLLSGEGLTSGREWTSAVDTLGKATGRRAILGNGAPHYSHWLVSHRGRLVLAPAPQPRSTMRLPEPGTYVYDDHTKIRISIVEGAVIRREATICCADADKVNLPLTLRPWQQGDRFHPLGMKGSKLVSDYLTDRHLSLIEKRQQLVACNVDGDIVWLVAQRPDNRFRVSPDTCKTLIIEFIDK